MKISRRHARNGNERAARIAKENKLLSTDCKVILKKKNAQLKELSERFEHFKKEKENQEVAGALKEDKHVCFSAEKFNDQDQLIRFYTGIVNWTLFLQLFNFIVSRCKDMKYWRSDVNADENHPHEPDQLRQGRPRSLSMLKTSMTRTS